MFDRWLEVDAKSKQNARKNSEQKKSKSKFQAILQKVTSENHKNLSVMKMSYPLI